MPRAKKTTSSRRRQTAPKEMDMMDQLHMMQPRSSQPSSLLVILLIIVAFFAGYLFFKVQSLEKGSTTGQLGQQGQQPAPRPTSLNIKKPSMNEHWRGASTVRYVWVEYSDLECPFCKRIHPDLQKLMSAYQGKVAWVFRHYPLPMHPKAEPAAEAVECAGELGGNEAFWKAVDAIYEKMPGVEIADLSTTAAVAAGVDSVSVKNCVDAKKHEQVIKADQTEGQTAGVQATPTNVIFDLQTGKTKLIEGAVPYDQLKQGLDDFMKG